ncbi:GLD2 polymerase, partial [Brachypteracias leptosomus]|nr:GLD2 polymerase [Brachypteracias leptosomus]
MLPNSSHLGHPPFPPKHQQQSNFFNKLPLNTPPAHLSCQQLIHAQLALHNEAIRPRQMTYENSSSLQMTDASMTCPRRKRRSERPSPDYAKRQRFQSHHSEATVVNQAVPLPEEHRYSVPAPIQSPLYPAHSVPDLTECAPPLQDILFSGHEGTVLPVAKDKLSQQILDLLHACQQRTCDLYRKELCRTELQREIKRVLPKSRLYLVGSSLNGFGTRNSDGDLCLVIKEEPMRTFFFNIIFQVNQKTEARHILSLVQKLFSTELSGYIEQPKLIRAKVPIVNCVDFDLNVNNIVGIRNTFLLRTYAQIENRVRPLVLAVKVWASFHDINDASRGTLNSYSLVLMVLHYLQTLPEPILPSLQKTYPESFDPAVQLHLVHKVTVPPYVSKNESSLGDLLIGFFKYYATEFDWNHQAISVREAKAIPRPGGGEWRSKFICIE